jgi:hypothetical protein
MQLMLPPLLLRSSPLLPRRLPLCCSCGRCRLAARLFADAASVPLPCRPLLMQLMLPLLL